MANITGTNFDETLFGTFGFDNIVALEGDDKVLGFWGHDKIYGDVKHVTLDFVSTDPTAPVVFNPMDDPLIDNMFEDHSVHALIPDFGNDTLFGGFGHDKIYGDSKTFDINIEGPDNVAEDVDASVTVLDLDVTFGDDKLFGGFGNDELYGDVKEFNLFMKAGDSAGLDSNSSVQVGTNQIPEATFFREQFTAADFIGLPGLEITFGNDVLFGGWGHDDIYGDLKNFDLYMEGGSYSDGGWSDSIAFGQHITLGDDTLYGNKGDDRLYGDAKDLDLTILGGNNGGDHIEGFLAFPLIMGNDHLEGGKGDDQLYGDARNISIFIAGSNNLTFNPNADQGGDFPGTEGDGEILTSGFSGAQNYLTFGDDVLYGGSGHDDIYGDGKWMGLEFIGGSNSQDQAPFIIAQSNAVVLFSSLEFGSDDLNGGSGDDRLYGDLKDFEMHFVGGDNTGAYTQNSAGYVAAISNTGPLNADVIFGSDDLVGGSGHDLLIGDIENFDMIFEGGDNAGIGSSAAAAVENNSDITTADLRMGDDYLDGGSGDDVLIGDIKSWYMDFDAGDNPDGGDVNPVTGPTNISAIFGFGNAKYMGNDVLEAGYGDDELYGDLKHFEMNFEAGKGLVVGGDSVIAPVLVAVAGIVTNSPTFFGNDEMNGGFGHDRMYGDVKFWEVNLEGGEVLDAGSEVTIAPPEIIAISGIESPIIFGSDMMLGDSGHDYMYGEGVAWNLMVQGGSVETAANPIFGPAAFTLAPAGIIGGIVFGNDYMEGGGGNDVLYGDWEEIDITRIDGATSSETPLGTEIVTADLAGIIFGDDTIIGGDGHDFIVGDVEDVQNLHTESDGTLISDSFVDDFYFGPGVIWGNDMLTGGSGDDTFFFEIQDNDGEMQTQGDDVITDLDAWDTIEFDDVLDVNGGGVDLSDLDAETLFSDVGGGNDLLIEFDGGGSLTLTGYGSVSIGSVIDSFADLENESGANVVI